MRIEIMKIGKLLVLSLTLFSGLAAQEVLANAHLDQQYQLESLGLLKSFDNVDHILTEYLETAYQNFFAQQSRFQAISSKTVDSILDQSKLPYPQLVSDPEILAQIARVTHANSLLRTQITQNGKFFHFKLDWLHVPYTEVLASIDFDLEVPRSGSSFDQGQYGETIQKNLSLLIAQVPFQGQVTGRDRDQVTLSLGEQDQLNPGDILTIGTLDGVKKHPLLKHISEWKLSNTGKVKIEKVEKGMSFGSIIEEEPGKQILKNQKIVFIHHLSLEEATQVASLSDQVIQEPHPSSSYDPVIGWGAFTLPMGTYERSFSSRAPALSYLGNRLTYGARAEGHILFNRDFFAYLRLSYQLWNYQQNDTASGQASTVSKNGGVPGSQTSALASIGYQISLTHSPNGPQGWVSLGYKVTSVGLPISVQEGTGPYTFKSLLLGVGINLSIRENWTLQTSLRYRVLTSVNAENLIGQASTSGTSDVEFYLGALYKLNEQFAFRGGLEIQSLSAEFENGSSLSQKTMTFAPALLYYF